MDRGNYNYCMDDDDDQLDRAYQGISNTIVISSDLNPRPLRDRRTTQLHAADNGHAIEQHHQVNGAVEGVQDISNDTSCNQGIVGHFQSSVAV